MRIDSLRQKLHPHIRASFGSATDVDVCWDWRSMARDGVVPVVDLMLLHHPVRDISSLLDGFSRAGELAATRQLVKAHLRAATTAELPVEELEDSELVPSHVQRNVRELWRDALLHVFKRTNGHAISEFLRSVSPVIPALRSIEETGTFIDRDRALAVANDENLDVHERSSARSFLDLSRLDGLARTRISPVGSKTRRLRVEGGMQCMSIQRGPARQCIVSRFSGGSILSIDFNAIDFRCLVADSGVDGYSGCDDFHLRTCELLGCPHELRSAVKAVTYVKLYGGSRETLLAKSGLPPQRLDRISAQIDEVLAPVVRYCGEVASRGIRDGHVDVEGYPVRVPPDSHPGRVVGLYAQTRSSFVFNRALVSLSDFVKNSGIRSRIIFPVHDEIVVDLAPEDERLIPEMSRATVANDPNFEVKTRSGKNYDDATR